MIVAVNASSEVHYAACASVNRVVTRHCLQAYASQMAGQEPITYSLTLPARTLRSVPSSTGPPQWIIGTTSLREENEVADTVLNHDGIQGAGCACTAQLPPTTSGSGNRSGY